MKKIIILPGTMEQFYLYIKDNNLSERSFINGYTPEKIYGVSAKEVIVVGTFWERKDANKLYELAKSRINL